MADTFWPAIGGSTASQALSVNAHGSVPFPFQVGFWIRRRTTQKPHMVARSLSLQIHR